MKIEKIPKSVIDNACNSKDMRLIATKLNEIINKLNEHEKELEKSIFL